ncbi:A/G-specific adenine glycosylase [Methanococcus maripaludis]|uniref:Adenine DNA glycosylase n=1 Tax=Methanococcus maripaludis TaxID=39152 RepID=A0A7J9NNI9_METMI|nr:A/G-specific adenine glycosylase [Methanococcus maripaludis]MBA2846609.1 A/G-specific adenine glycosylase [Methanococcus maripaludis]
MQDNENFNLVKSELLEWYSKNKRSFPWRYTKNPYQVLVSEILLQQTNAEKVVSPYLKIVSRYHTIEELADADLDFLSEIFKELGLFYRSERLINISKEILSKYNGKVPCKKEELLKITGIGRYTAGAVLCFGCGMHSEILDSNIIRLFDRIFGVKSDKKRPHTDKDLWNFAEEILPAENCIDYNYALLDFAALVCKAKNPLCDGCPLNNICNYLKNR